MLSGFCFSGYLIWNSVDNWQKNPVATTISTHPIEMVTFPRVYVCPPKGTYTNLNYDIVENSNKLLSNDQVANLTSFINELTYKGEQEHALNDIDSFVEENKFYNWYSGMSTVTKPFYVPRFGQPSQVISHRTSRTSGFIQSPYFGQKFQKNKFYSIMLITIIIKDILLHVSEETKLVLEIQMDMKEVQGGHEDLSVSLMGGWYPETIEEFTNWAI